MHSLIVTAHPESGSLTHAIARRIGEAITAADAANTVTHADLMAEGFDPRFNPQDQALFRGTGAVPADVASEQASHLDFGRCLVSRTRVPEVDAFLNRKSKFCGDAFRQCDELLIVRF